MQNEAYMFIIKYVKSKTVSNSMFFIWVKIFHKILAFYLYKGNESRYFRLFFWDGHVIREIFPNFLLKVFFFQQFDWFPKY